MPEVKISRRGIFGALRWGAAVATSPARIASAVNAHRQTASAETFGAKLGVHIQAIINVLDTYQWIKETTTGIGDFMQSATLAPREFTTYDKFNYWRNHLDAMDRAGLTLKDTDQNIDLIKSLHKSYRGMEMHPQMLENLGEIEGKFIELYGSTSIPDAVKATENRIMDRLVEHFEFMTTLPIEEALHKYPHHFEDVMRGFDKGGSRQGRIVGICKILDDRYAESKKPQAEGAKTVDAASVVSEGNQEIAFPGLPAPYAVRIMGLAGELTKIPPTGAHALPENKPGPLQVSYQPEQPLSHNEARVVYGVLHPEIK